MRIKLKLFVAAFLFLITFIISCQNNNIKIYKNQDALFYFKYPSNKMVYYKERKDKENNKDKFLFTIEVDYINDIKDNEYLRYDKKSTLEEKEYLESGKIGQGIGIIFDKKMIELIDLKNNYGEIITYLTFHSIEDIIFERKLLFFNNNHRVIITFHGDSFNEQIIKSMNKFFIYEEILEDYKWAGRNFIYSFLKELKEGKASKLALDWYNGIYEITENIKLFPNYFIPAINNLHLRNNSNLKGKVLRLLKKQENLNLLEIGNEEIINGIKGTWVKVKTEKGEVGWCFDAYLEEVKKK